MHMQVFGSNIGTKGGREQWGKSVVVYITTLTMGFSGRVFFSFFFRPSILGGVSESVDSRAGDERRWCR